MSLEDIIKAVESSTSKTEACKKLKISRQGLDYLLRKYNKKVIKTSKLEVVSGGLST